MRIGRHLKRETDTAISDAAEHKLKRLEQQAKATRKTEKKLINDLLKLRQEKVFKTGVDFNEFIVSVGNNEKNITKEIKNQIRILHKVSTHVLTHVHTSNKFVFKFTNTHSHRCMVTRESL